MNTNPRPLLASAAVCLIAVTSLVSASATLTVLSAADGAPACAVSAVSGSADTLAVDVREPAAPSADALASFAPDARDFSTVPMAIRLETSGADATRTKLPLSIEADLRHGVIGGVDAGFARAIFPRAWLTAGAVVVGERSRVAPDGRRVSTQTRCPISAADAAHWR